MSNRGTGLLGQDEAGTDPNSGGTQHESSGNRVTVEQATSGDDLHGQTGQRTVLALAELGDGGDEDGGRDIAGVSSTFATLRADDIGTRIKRFLNVLGVADHVHVQDTGAVETVDNMLGRDTDGRNEEPGAAFNDNIDEFVEFALGVVIANERITG